MPNWCIAKDQILELFIVKVVIKKKKGKKEEHNNDEEAYYNDKARLRHLRNPQPCEDY